MNLVLKIAILQRYPCQADFAQKAGICEALVSKIVRERRQPTPEQAKKISQTLQVPADELFASRG